MSILNKSGYHDYWAACASMCLEPNQLQPVVKTILAHKGNPSYTYLVTQFLQQKPDLLDTFATDSISSKNILVRHLAISHLIYAKDIWVWPHRGRAEISGNFKGNYTNGT